MDINTDFPLVSVVIPTLNRPDFIKETLDSVINQTYRNLEIIISDNGSNYDVKEYLKTYFSNDSRIVFRKNKYTILPALHFNQCLEFASGKYFIIICDDDFISNNFIELLVKEFEINPNLSIGLTKNNQINEFSELIKENQIVPWKIKNGKLFLDDWLKGNEIAPVSSFISLFANRVTLLKSGGFPNFQDASHSDNASAINLALRGDVLFLNDIIFSYRVYKQSFGLKLNYSSLSKASREFINYFKKNEFLRTQYENKNRNEIINGVKELCFKTYITRLRSNYNLKGIKYLKGLINYKLTFFEFAYLIKMIKIKISKMYFND